MKEALDFDEFRSRAREFQAEGTECTKAQRCEGQGWVQGMAIIPSVLETEVHGWLGWML